MYGHLSDVISTADYNIAKEDFNALRGQEAIRAKIVHCFFDAWFGSLSSCEK